MAATVVAIRDKEEWNRVIDLLGRLEQGGIIVSPEACEILDSEHPGWEDGLDKYIDYDFGGEPEVMIDVARPDNFAMESLKNAIVDQ